MTADEAKRVLLDVLDAHLDERVRGQGKAVTEKERAAGREAMDRFLQSKGIDFSRLGASFTEDALRQAATRLIRAGLS